MTIEDAPQYMKALAKGNEIRLARAQIKRDLAAGRRDICDLISDPPDALASMPVIELLMAQHRWGQTRSGRALRGLWDPRVMAPLTIAEQRKLGELTDRQRRVLVNSLRGDPASRTTAA
jgi:hypothetical protein